MKHPRSKSVTAAPEELKVWIKYFFEEIFYSKIFKQIFIAPFRPPRGETRRTNQEQRKKRQAERVFGYLGASFCQGWPSENLGS